MFYCLLTPTYRKYDVLYDRLIPVAERYNARVYGRSLAGFAGSIPARGMDVCAGYYK